VPTLRPPKTGLLRRDLRPQFALFVLLLSGFLSQAGAVVSLDRDDQQAQREHEGGAELHTGRQSGLPEPLQARREKSRSDDRRNDQREQLDPYRDWVITAMRPIA